MIPSSENPMVKDNIKDTLNELVNSMVFLVDAMPTMVEKDSKDEEQLIISPLKFDGLRSQLDVIRAATETAYSQCLANNS